MFTSGFLFESCPLRSRAFFSEYLREGTGTWAGACRGEGGFKEFIQSNEICCLVIVRNECT